MVYNGLMSLESITILTGLVIGFTILGWLIKRWLLILHQQNQADVSLLEWLKSTQSSMSTENQHINQTLHANTQAINQRLDMAAKYMSNLS